MELEKVKTMIEEYIKTDKQSALRNAIAIRLNELNNINTLKEMTKLLVINLAETSYINKALAIETAEYIWQLMDLNTQVGIGARIQTSGQAKESIGRIIVYLRRKLEKAVSEKKNAQNEAEDLRLSISNLIRGKAEIIDCSICEGLGKTSDGSNRLIECWNCNGDKKVIEGKSEKFELEKN